MIKKYSHILFIPLISVLFLSLSFSSEALNGKRSADGRYVDNGNEGTITDTKTGLTWAKKDSWADLGKCLDWNDSKIYVSNLNTGGHTDWRLPTVNELSAIYEKSKNHGMGFEYENFRSEFPLGLDSIFADGAAYVFWSSETIGSCCARYVTFVNGIVGKDLRDDCFGAGVRAVRR